MFSKRLANHIFIAVILVLTGVTEGKIFNAFPLGDVDVTVSSSSLNSRATLTSGGLYQSNSAPNQWLRIDLLEPHFITSFVVYIGQGTQLDQIHLLGRVGGNAAKDPRLDGAFSWTELQIIRESNRVQFSPYSSSGQEVTVYRRLAVISTSSSGLVVDKVTFYAYMSNAFRPGGVTLNFSSSGTVCCATCQWNAPEGSFYLVSYNASLTGDPSLIDVGQNMSTKRCGYTKGQEVTCVVAVKGATTSASRVQMVPYAVPTKPDVTGLSNRVEVTESGRRRWRYTVSWRAPSSTGCLYISRYEYSYQGGSIRNLSNNINSMHIFADGAERVTFSIRSCNNQDYCSDYYDFPSVPTTILRPQIVPLDFTVTAHSTRSECVKLTWSPPQYPNGDITEYQYNCGGGWQSAGDGNTRSVECAGGGFTPYESVTCQLKARNSAGDSNVNTETTRTKCAAPGFTSGTELGQYVFENKQSMAYRRLKINIPDSYSVRRANCANIRSLNYKLNNTGYGKSNNQYYTDLPAVTTYQLTIRLTNNKGMESDTVIYKTTGELPPGLINVYTTTYNKVCVMVYWRKPEQPNGIITDYQYRCRCRGTSWPSQWTSHTESMSAAACGYTPGQRVSCQARASTSEGYGPASTSNETQVACSEPDAPALNVTDSIDTSTGRERVTLNVAWPAVESNCDSITGYTVTVSAGDIVVVEPTGSLIGSLHYYSHVIHNLSAYTNYTVMSTATNNKDLSTSAGIVHLTRELKPGPMNLELSALDEVCVTLRWTAPGSPHGRISSFQYKCSALRNDTDGIDWHYIDWITVSADITKERSCVFRPGDRAECKARAVNNAGNGAESDSNIVVVEEPKCPGIPYVNFTSAVPPRKSTHGSRVIYECHTGYLKTEGSSYLSCDIDDFNSLQWKGTPPVCEKKKVTMKQPVNTEEPSGHSTATPKRLKPTEEPLGKEILISVSVGSVLVIGIIVAVAVAYKRRNRNHTQGDASLTPMSRTHTELRNAHTDFPDDMDNQADIPLVLAPGFDSRQTDRPSGGVGNYYSTIDDSVGYEIPIRSNQSPPTLPERNDNSHQDNIERAEEESVPHYLPMS